MFRVFVTIFKMLMFSSVLLLQPEDFEESHWDIVFFFLNLIRYNICIMFVEDKYRL